LGNPGQNAKEGDQWLTQPCLWTAGRARAGVLLVLPLVAFQYLDATNLSDATKTLVRWATPSGCDFDLSGVFLVAEK
jgi:hypothetical protein